MLKPKLSHGHEVLLMVVALFGTTISPYLFFWQAAQEMEDTRSADDDGRTPGDVRRHLRRIKSDTIVGMMLLASRRRTMGIHVIGTRLRWLGWLATTAMAAVVTAMFASV